MELVTIRLLIDVGCYRISLVHYRTTFKSVFATRLSHFITRTSLGFPRNAITLQIHPSSFLQSTIGLISFWITFSLVHYALFMSIFSSFSYFINFCIMLTSMTTQCVCQYPNANIIFPKPHSSPKSSSNIQPFTTLKVMVKTLLHNYWNIAKVWCLYAHHMISRRGNNPPDHIP